MYYYINGLQVSERDSKAGYIRLIRILISLNNFAVGLLENKAAAVFLFQPLNCFPVFFPCRPDHIHARHSFRSVTNPIIVWPIFWQLGFPDEKGLNMRILLAGL